MLTSSIIVSNSADAGGGISLSTKARLQIGKNCLIRTNHARVGAGLWAGEESGLSVQSEGVIFEGNDATERGGGVMLTHTNCPAEDSLVTPILANSLAVMPTDAAAIEAATNADLPVFRPCIYLQSVQFRGNTAASGGGLFWRFVNSTLGELSTHESRDFVCKNWYVSNSYVFSFFGGWGTSLTNSFLVILSMSIFFRLLIVTLVNPTCRPERAQTPWGLELFIGLQAMSIQANNCTVMQP